MRTFLTGAGGYIGLHILRELLEAGHRVTAVVRAAAKLGLFVAHPRLSVVETDLEDQGRITEALLGPEACIHAALIWREPGSELEMRDTAVAAQLFQASERAGLERCIYISSAAVHRPFSGEMSEDDSLSATDLYGATKAAGELFLRAACAKSQMRGVVVRPGPVVCLPAFAGGAFRSNDRLTEMVAAATAGRPITVERADGRQFSDVAAVGRSVSLLTGMDDPEPAYICVDREVITWERVASLAIECLGSSSEIRVVPNQGQGAIPHFRTDRFERLIGGPSDASRALTEHIRYLRGLLDRRPATGV